MVQYITEKRDHNRNTAMITGATGAIGKETAKVFAKNGNNLILVDYKSDVIKLADEIAAQYGVKTIGICCALTKPEDVDAAIKVGQEQVGPIHILVNLCGRFEYDVTLSLEDALVVSQLNQNVIGSYFVTKIVGEQMIKQEKGGKIICVTSQDEYIAMNKHIGYHMCKAAVVAMTKQLAIEWEKYDININTIVPVVYQSCMDDKKWNQQLNEKFSREMFPDSMPEAHMIASSIKFLTSVEANMMSGEDFIIDMKCSYQSEKKSA